MENTFSAEVPHTRTDLRQRPACQECTTWQKHILPTQSAVLMPPMQKVVDTRDRKCRSGYMPEDKSHQLLHLTLMAQACECALARTRKYAVGRDHEGTLENSGGNHTEGNRNFLHLESSTHVTRDTRAESSRRSVPEQTHPLHAPHQLRREHRSPRAGERQQYAVLSASCIRIWDTRRRLEPNHKHRPPPQQTLHSLANRATSTATQQRKQACLKTQSLSHLGETTQHGDYHGGGWETDPTNEDTQATDPLSLAPR